MNNIKFWKSSYLQIQKNLQNISNLKPIKKEIIEKYEEKLTIYFQNKLSKYSNSPYNFSFKSPNTLYISENSKNPNTEYFLSLHFFPSELNSTHDEYFTLFQLKNNINLVQSSQELNNLKFLGELSNILLNKPTQIFKKINLDNKILRNNLLTKIIKKEKQFLNKINSIKQDLVLKVLYKGIYKILTETSNFKIDWSSTPLPLNTNFPIYLPKQINVPISDIQSDIYVKHIQIVNLKDSTYEIHLVSSNNNLIYKIEVTDLKTWVLDLVQNPNNYDPCMYAMSVYFNDIELLP